MSRRKRDAEGRVEAFSDGIFAIAATLLVLNLHVPSSVELSMSMGEGLMIQWPSFIAYLVSFMTIGIIWVNHHAMLSLLRDVDRPLLFLNLLLLLWVSVIPFPTSLLGAYITAGQDAHLAAAIYGGNMSLMALSFSAMWLHATRDNHLLYEALPQGQAARSLAKFSLGMGAYLAGVLLAFVSPLLSLVIYAGVAIFYLQPSLPGRKSVRIEEQRPGGGDG